MRRLLPIRIAAYVVCGTIIGQSPLAAQQGSTRDGQPANATTQTRPEGEAFHVAAVSPELEALLQTWYDKTKGIEKLQGAHTRWMYERTFFSASVAKGKFYYEAPDKGRIDIAPAKPDQDIDPQTEGIQIKDTTQNVYTYTECTEESWISDGKSVMEINHPEKTFTEMPIPPSQQGVNIMDGPLPFLFGLPPEKAKARYNMKIEPRLTTDKLVCVNVKPLLKQDASNWDEAQVILFRESFLPYAVKLISQNGINTTVYVFADHEVNNVNFLKILGVHPFRPPVSYAQTQNQSPAPLQPLRTNGKPIEGVPAIGGLSYKEAFQVLGQRGYREVQVIPTAEPCDPKMRHIVKDQNPKPGATVSKDQPIQLILYATQEDIDKFNASQKKAEK